MDQKGHYVPEPWQCSYCHKLYRDEAEHYRNPCFRWELRLWLGKFLLWRK